jgi:ATP-binding cassette, subfamily B, multidrug efflux pump
VTTGPQSIFRLVFRYPGRIAIGLASLLLVDLGQFVVPLIIRSVIDGITAGTITTTWLGQQALLLLALALAIALLRFIWRYCLFSASRLAEQQLRESIYAHAQSLPYHDVLNTPTGEVMALATNDVESVRQVLSMGFVAGFDALVYVVVGIGAIVWLDAEIALWVVLPLPALALLMVISLRAVFKRWDAVQASFEDLTERARESIAGIRVIKTFAQEDNEARRFAAVSADYFHKFMRYIAIEIFFHPAIMLLTGTCIALLLMLGGARVMSGALSVGTFVAISSYLTMLVWPMIAIGWLFTLFQRAAASLARINVYLAKPGQEDHTDSQVAQNAAPFRGALTVRDLTFCYPGSSTPALDSLSFDLPAGGSLGLVGEIGSGKSTVTRLLLRFYEPPHASVFIDDTDVRDLRLERLRAAIALVPQEAFLFSDTIAANLDLGKPDASAAERELAARLAAVHEEIERFPQGYETLLGERGITVSGGQRQRLCLARALLKPAPIVVLDDTLAAVDAQAEREILASLAQVRQGRTLLVISHRISAVRELDRILVLRQGRVIESGTHAQLLAHDGFYRHLAELQELEEEIP